MKWEKLNYAEIVHRCFRCGYCKFPSDYSEINCPSYVKYRFETYFSGGRMWLIRAWLKGDVEWSEHLGEIIYSCSTCRNCVENCVFRFSDQIVDVFISARSDMVERAEVPGRVAEFLSNVAKFGNPWGEKQSKRVEWADGKFYDGNEWLLFAGCVASYDTRSVKALKAFKKLLEIAEIDYGVMRDEKCEGNEVLMLGEVGLFEELEKHNLKRFEELGVRKIVTTDPHVFNAIKNCYDFDGEIVHHSQLLYDAIRKGKLEPGELKVRATYHDPCFLGRWNGIYSEPRKVLQRISGLRLIEMKRSKKNSLCCGGGSGNFYTDYLSGKDSPSRVRVREASEIADVIVTSCPICLTMLEDAVKSENLDMEVRDIAEVVLDSMD